MLMDEPKEKEASFKYNADDKPDDNTSDQNSADSELEPKIDTTDTPLFNWSASDSFSVKKSSRWYLTLLVITLIFSVIIYLITKDKITTSVIVVSGLLIGVYAAKKPKVVNYQLTKFGFTINGRQYHYGDFRSFSIVQHGASGSAVFTPLKRFVPYTYIYFKSDLEEQVSSAIANVLPKENSHRDAIDKVLRKIGF